jgi:hypothetical protein
MNELNNKLDGLNELITRIDAKILDISNKLDEVIAAIHEYDDDQLEWPEPNDALLKAAGLYNEAKANKRMDIIGQNGNEGSHYVTNEEADEDAATFDDYGKRIVWVDENKSNNNPAKHVGEKKRNKRKYYKPKQ